MRFKIQSVFFIKNIVIIDDRKLLAWRGSRDAPHFSPMEKIQNNWKTFGGGLMSLLEGEGLSEAFWSIDVRHPNS